MISLEGSRPIGIGEIKRRLIAKMVMAQVMSDATMVCGAQQLCAGLPSGIKGAVYAMEERWQERTSQGTNVKEERARKFKLVPQEVEEK